MICKNCGNQLNEGDKVCGRCGSVVHVQTKKNGKKFLPSFILGLIASIFGIGGGFFMTMCSSFYSSGNAAFILIFGGSIVGLIGACQCLKNVLIGSILELVAAVMIIICAYGPIGGDFMTVLSMILFIASGAIGMIYFFVSKKLWNPIFIQALAIFPHLSLW